jgi:RNA polymerase sigma-70 factor (sigma-E family)
MMSLDGVAISAPAGGIDADALVADLFRGHARSLVRLARIFTDDRDAAEDIVQEAFIRLHRAAHTIRDPARAPAFLRSIVLNLSRDHNRRGLMSFRHRAAGAVSDVNAGFEDEAVEAADPAMLEALRSLSTRQRDCLVLRYYLELSDAEIADTIGISVNSVKTHTRRAMGALGARLSQPEVTP